MSYDLAKTQFLITDHGTHTAVTAFRRSRELMLFDKSGNPVRRIAWKDWERFKAAYPAEIEADGISVKRVLTLVPVIK